MFCPKCSSTDTQVYDSRVINDGKTIKRRRECTTCGYRFTTLEELKVVDIYVKKRSGQEVTFNKEKLQNSIQKAFNKRKVNNQLINSVVEEVTNTIVSSSGDMVSSEEIGNMVISKLRDVDQAAYICFMAMFKNFETAEDFINLVKQFEISTTKKSKYAKSIINP
jgi:transcriptional repressor NrdR